MWGALVRGCDAIGGRGGSVLASHQFANGGSEIEGGIIGPIRLASWGATGTPALIALATACSEWSTGSRLFGTFCR
jgi:hypothetical protein